MCRAIYNTNSHYLLCEPFQQLPDLSNKREGGDVEAGDRAREREEGREEGKEGQMTQENKGRKSKIIIFLQTKWTLIFVIYSTITY